MRFWDGQPLRYVLKHKDQSEGIDQELLVVVIALIPDAKVKEEEDKWKGAESSNSKHAQEDGGKPQDQKGDSYVDADIDWLEDDSLYVYHVRVMRITVDHRMVGRVNY